MVTRDWNERTETERLGPFRSAFGVAGDVAVSSASEYTPVSHSAV